MHRDRRQPESVRFVRNDITRRQRVMLFACVHAACLVSWTLENRPGRSHS